MKPIKLQLKRRAPFGYNWVRFHVVEKILLTTDSIIRTEGQLCKYMLDKHGVGRYQILAWQGGYEGFWLFWLGDILPNGFMRDINKNKEVEKLKKEFFKADNYEDKSTIEQEIEVEKDFFKIEKQIKRRGPRMILTTKPGVLSQYEEY